MHERNGDRSECALPLLSRMQCSGRRAHAHAAGVRRLLDSLRLLPRLERTFSDSDVLIAAVPHSPFATPPALTVLYYAPCVRGARWQRCPLPLTAFPLLPMLRSGMEKIAQATQRMCGGDVCLGRINWDCFPDGFPNLRIEGAELLADRRVVFLACLDRKEVLFEQVCARIHGHACAGECSAVTLLLLHQMAVIYALPRYAAKSFQILLPFFPTATMERVERMGQVATVRACATDVTGGVAQRAHAGCWAVQARTMARILSATPHAQRGPTQISIMGASHSSAGWVSRRCRTTTDAPPQTFTRCRKPSTSPTTSLSASRAACACCSSASGSCPTTIVWRWRSRTRARTSASPFGLGRIPPLCARRCEVWRCFRVQLCAAVHCCAPLCARHHAAVTVTRVRSAEVRTPRGW